MHRMSLLWHLFGSYLTITLAILSVVTLGAWSSLRQFHFQQTRQDLAVRADLVASLVADGVRYGDRTGIDVRCKAAGRRTATRFTVILPSGEVIGDSDHDPATMVNHTDRPEVRQALGGAIGVAVRESATLHRPMMYVAVPLVDGGRIAGVVRAALALTEYQQALRTLQTPAFLGLLFLALAAIAASLFFSRRLSRPLEQARSAAMRFASGNLLDRLPEYGSREFVDLARAMNLMAAQIDAHIRTITRQRSEQEAILASMIEGVLAVDRQERIINVNAAACAQLELDPRQVQGRSIQEAIRHSELQRFLAAVLAAREPQEDEIALRLAGELRWLQLHGTLLLDEDHCCIGALIVMTDVTRLHRLETVRSDFVANVSHELRTPIAAIKGFVETLLDGSLANPQEAARFLGIIDRHTNRMTAIIEDLLALSRLEQQSTGPAVSREACTLSTVIEQAMQNCALPAAEKEIHLTFTGDPTVTAPVNSTLMEQALVNLIDNAIKYGPERSEVAIAMTHDGQETRIVVRDQGCGIPAEHLPRIFERFYMVDTGRSRKIGGTGLGLAIVKHIVQLHKGHVTVESTPGAGSTFTIHLPNDL